MPTGAFYELSYNLQIKRGPRCRPTTLDYGELSEILILKRKANQLLYIFLKFATELLATLVVRSSTRMNEVIEL